MRIDAGGIIADVPILRVREFLKRCDGNIFSQTAEHYLKLEASAAQALLEALEADGRLERRGVDRDGDQIYVKTIAGEALANASAAKPARRATAQRALDGFLLRVEEVNRNPLAKAKVSEVILFGSFLDPTVASVSDVDLAVNLTEIPLTAQEHEEVFERIIGRRGAVAKPGEVLVEEDVYRYLKGRSPLISIVKLRQHLPLLAEIPHRRIWPV